MSDRLTLERWTDVRAQAWYSGDTRCHVLPPHAALLEGAAEDVAVVNLLAKEVYLASLKIGAEENTDLEGRAYLAIPNLLAFSGQKPALEMPGHLVAVNTYN